MFPKPKRISSKRYLEFIRSLPCVNCGRPAEAHHAETGGMGIKANDTRTISLCHPCHQMAHSMGIETFQREHNICFKDVMLRCMETYILIHDS